MTEIQGSVHSIRIDQERGGVVLRLVIKMDSGQKVPVEMRGHEVRGVLEVGDQIMVRGRRLRDRDGVIRPRDVDNLTSSSRVTVPRDGVLRRFFRFVFSLTISVVSGAATTVLVSLVTGSPVPHTRSRSTLSPLGGEPLLILSTILGIGVGLLVFYMIYLRRRFK